MKSGRVSLLLLFLTVVLLNVCLLNEIQSRVLQINCFPYDITYDNMRKEEIGEDLFSCFMRETDGNMESFSELLTMYFATDCTVTDVSTLKEDIAYVKKYRPQDFEKIRQYVYAIWESPKRFPVGRIDSNPDATVTFSNSWMQSRSFGGDRGHEGCDIMASVNERGIYPIYSMTDGVVENIGWLRLGGYRIGIRSDLGAYFYYAHMAEYAKEFTIGERVEAGTFLGFMGDTGYSEVPGTTGNFDVHLHLGIYLYDEEGREFSVNSYPILRYLWKEDTNGD